VKPSLCFTELVVLIAATSTRQELEHIRQVVEAELDRYTLPEVIVLMDLLVKRLKD
jgi:hypothetical protein